MKSTTGINMYDIGYLAFPWIASGRGRDLTYTEQKRGYRVLGGDKGDIRFRGYDTDEAGTELIGVELRTYLNLSDSEAREIAIGIVEEAYVSVGTECVEHS